MGRPYKIKRHKRIYRRSAGNIILRVLIIVAAVAARLVVVGWWVCDCEEADGCV